MQKPRQHAMQSPSQIVDAFFSAVAAKDRAAIKGLVREDYIQHSPFAATGRQGLLDVLDTLSGLKIERHRMLVDKDLVALHQTYTQPDGTRMVAFDVFRIEDQQLAEHWDASQIEVPQDRTLSGRSMTDGETKVGDLANTERNRQVVLDLARIVLTEGQVARLPEFVSADSYAQHNPQAADELAGVQALMAGLQQAGLTFYYTDTPLVVAMGDFVLIGSQGVFGPLDSKPYAIFYDLFRVENGLVVEHWDVIPASPDPSALPHGNHFF